MQSHLYSQNVRLPYSKWSQHRAENGLIYLSHPVTGEVKWLWSRHHDPKTSNDYLVNTITGDRKWVTKQNEHLCPIKPLSGDSAATRSSQAHLAPNATFPAAKGSNNSSQTQASNSNPVSKPASATYREIAAPKSMGLTADEVLMLVPETGRRYVYNKKTKSSRWLPSRPPDTIPSESKPRFGRDRNSGKSSSPFDDGEIAAELKEKTRFTESKPTMTSSTTSSRASDSGSVHSLGQQRPVTSHTQRTTPSSPYFKENAARPMPLSADEAAVYVQRAFRGNIVRSRNLLEKLRVLTNVVDDVKRLTGSGKYDISYLRSLANRKSNMEERREGAKRLLELGEYLTQQMLKVDDVESSGNQLVRAKRKQSVKMILGLTDEVDALRKKVR